MQPGTRQKAIKNVKKAKNPYIQVVYFALFLFVTVFLISQSLRSIRLTYQKVGILEIAQNEVDQLRLKNIKLLSDKDEVITDDYIETVARNRLNYSREGEVAFIITDDVIEDPVLDQYLEQYKGYYIVKDSGVQQLPDFYDSWVGFFIEGV